MSLKSESVGALSSHPIGRQALRLADSPPFFVEEVQFWSNAEEDAAHSLHGVVTLPNSFRPDVPGFLIRKYSKRGSIVLDPFCGAGTTGLEANMLGRAAFLSDVSPLALSIANAKLNPADLAEVTLGLQALALRRPVEMGPFGDIFKHFFDAETFREIVNLRALLSQRQDRIGNFIKLVALSLLHGPSAGYFSAPTSQVTAITPQEQAELNRQRRQLPDYRPVMPRVLRKTAAVLRDGVPSVMKQITIQNRTVIADARDLSYVPSAAVDLVLTQPPLPGPENVARDQWLKLWFLGVQASQLSQQVWRSPSVDGWLAFMNEVLVEFARVVRGGGRVCLALQDVLVLRRREELDLHLIDMVKEQLSRFWNVECLLVHREKLPTVGSNGRGRRSDQPGSDTKVVVLRRR